MNYTSLKKNTYFLPIICHFLTTHVSSEKYIWHAIQASKQQKFFFYVNFFLNAKMCKELHVIKTPKASHAPKVHL